MSIRVTPVVPAVKSLMQRRPFGTPKEIRDMKGPDRNTSPEFQKILDEAMQNVQKR